MNELTIFKNEEFGEIRTMLIEGEPWFVAKDVALVLGYAKPLNAIGAHVDADDSLKQGVTDNLGRVQGTLFINESGLYSLILSSQLPGAKRFKRWVTREVLPSLRKTGNYAVGPLAWTDAEIMAKALLISQSTIEQQASRIKSLEGENSALAVDNAIMQPKADYFDDLVDRNMMTNFTEAAKQIGVKRKSLIGFLTDHGYLYRDKKGNLLPYANKKSDGLFAVKTSVNHKTGWVGCQTVLTPKGMETFRLLCQGM